MSKATAGRLARLQLALLLVCLVAACDRNGATDTAASTPALKVIVAEAESKDVQLFIDMVGTTLGTQDVPIRARVEGFLESIDFQEGTFVKKGELLYTIDDQPFQAKLVAAQSELAASQTMLAKSASDLSRIKPLAEMKAVSEQDLDGAVAQEAAARASVQASEAAVELAEIELSYTRIDAPIDGLIGLTKAKPGEFVGREPNPVVLNTLSDIDPIRVRFSISEREYLIMARTYLATHKGEGRGRRPDDRPADLLLILADDTEHPHMGRAEAASQAINQDTGTYTVEASFPNPTLVLLPGQFARVRARYETLEGVVVIPRKGISELQGLFRIYVVDDSNQVVMREVTLGPDSGDDVVVESGLAVGERVIVEGIQKVRPGMTVEPVSSQSAASSQE